MHIRPRQCDACIEPQGVAARALGLAVANAIEHRHRDRLHRSMLRRAA